MSGIYKMPVAIVIFPGIVGKPLAITDEPTEKHDPLSCGIVDHINICPGIWFGGRVYLMPITTIILPGIVKPELLFIPLSTIENYPSPSGIVSHRPRFSGTGTVGGIHLPPDIGRAIPIELPGIVKTGASRTYSPKEDETVPSRVVGEHKTIPLRGPRSES